MFFIFELWRATMPTYDYGCRNNNRGTKTHFTFGNSLTPTFFEKWFVLGTKNFRN